MLYVGLLKKMHEQTIKDITDLRSWQTKFCLDRRLDKIKFELTSGLAESQVLPYMVKWAPGGAPGAKTWTSPPESNKKWAPRGAQIKLSARGADFTGPHFTGGHYRGANTNGRWFYGLVFSQFLVRMSFWASWCYGWCEQLASPKTGPEKPIPGDFSCIFFPFSLGFSH